MKIFSSEFIKAYETYSFGYTQYCLLEEKGDLPQIYARGFLPYSNDPELRHMLFYMARSLRVHLKNYNLSSENKRVAKKMEELDLVMICIQKEHYDLSQPEFEKFCLHYATTRFSNSSMTLARFRHIMNMPLGTHLFKFTSNGSVLGYVFTVLESNILHYWYSFFDLQYLRSHSLGKYMMSEIIKWAAENDFDYVYLGTCYGEHSLYKVRDFKGIEYWDGTFWSHDKKYLKTICKSDEVLKTVDTFKIHGDRNAYLDKILEAI